MGDVDDLRVNVESLPGIHTSASQNSEGLSADYSSGGSQRSPWPNGFYPNDMNARFQQTQQQFETTTRPSSSMGIHHAAFLHAASPSMNRPSSAMGQGRTTTSTTTISPTFHHSFSMSSRPPSAMGQEQFTTTTTNRSSFSPSNPNIHPRPMTPSAQTDRPDGIRVQAMPSHNDTADFNAGIRVQAVPQPMPAPLPEIRIGTPGRDMYTRQTTHIPDVRTGTPARDIHSRQTMASPRPMSAFQSSASFSTRSGRSTPAQAHSAGMQFDLNNPADRQALREQARLNPYSMLPQVDGLQEPVSFQLRGGEVDGGMQWSTPEISASGGSMSFSSVSTGQGFPQIPV
jgi:hypothetical protein